MQPNFSAINDACEAMKSFNKTPDILWGKNPLSGWRFKPENITSIKTIHATKALCMVHSLICGMYVITPL